MLQNSGGSRRAEALALYQRSMIIKVLERSPSERGQKVA